jgi:hypothetical protein
MSEIARIVAKFDDTIGMVDRFDSVVDRLEELVKENPNDADLGLEVRKLVRELIEYRDKY